MINKKQVEKEYTEITKNNEKIINTVKEESSIIFNVTIGIITIFASSFILDVENIFYILLIIYIFFLYKNQKLIDSYIIYNLNNYIELSKVAAIISKTYYEKIFIKIILLCSFNYMDFFKEFVIFYIVMEIIINIYFMVFTNKFNNVYIAYIYKRVDLYLRNELYENSLNNKFIKTYGENK